MGLSVHALTFVPLHGMGFCSKIKPSYNIPVSLVCLYIFYNTYLVCIIVIKLTCFELKSLSKSVISDNLLSRACYGIMRARSEVNVHFHTNEST